METLFKSIDSLIDRLLTRQTLTEIAAVLATFGLAWFLGRFVRDWLIRRESPAPTTFRGSLAEGAKKLSPFVVALLLLFVVRSVLDAVDLSTVFLDLTLRLLSALVLIRVGVFLLRLSLGPTTWLKTWETQATLIVWSLVALNLLGWLDPIVNKLDHVGFTIGKNKEVTIWSIFKALFIITLFVLGATWIARWIERRVMTLSGVAASTRIGISKFAHAFLIAFGILIGLSTAGLDLTTLTIFTGAIGIGLGFGLQAIASNFVSGFVLLMDRSIKPGDVISFTGVGGTSTEGFGWVQELRGRYVVVRDRDGVETLVPNQNLITNSVINWSYTDPKVRIKLPVRISYQDDPELALKMLLKAAEGQRRILREPPPVSRLMAFTDYGMDLELRFWIADPQEGVNNVRSDVNRVIWKLFKENGITIPVAQREIRIHSAVEDAEDWVYRQRAQGKE
jgi:small-conductance mechanosensitive channel